MLCQSLKPIFSDKRQNSLYTSQLCRSNMSRFLSTDLSKLQYWINNALMLRTIAHTDTSKKITAYDLWLYLVILQAWSISNFKRQDRCMTVTVPAGAVAPNCSRQPAGIIQKHYSNVIMDVMACQITGLTIAYSNIYSGADQRKPQSPASLAFGRGIHRRPVNSEHKGPVKRKMFPFDDVIMWLTISPEIAWHFKSWKARHEISKSFHAAKQVHWNVLFAVFDR